MWDRWQMVMFFMRGPMRSEAEKRKDAVPAASCWWCCHMCALGAWTVSFGTAALLIAYARWDDPCLANVSSSVLTYPQWLAVYGIVLCAANGCIACLLSNRVCNALVGAAPSRVLSRVLVLFAVGHDVFQTAWWVVGVATWSAQVHGSCDGPIDDFGAAVIGIEAARICATFLYVCFFGGRSDAAALWDGDGSCCCGC